MNRQTFVSTYFFSGLLSAIAVCTLVAPSYSAISVQAADSGIPELNATAMKESNLVSALPKESLTTFSKSVSPVKVESSAAQAAIKTTTSKVTLAKTNQQLVDLGSGDEAPSKVSAQTFISQNQSAIKKKFSKPKDTEIMDEPWSVSGGGNGIIVNEDGMVLPHTNDFAHEQLHHHPSPARAIGIASVPGVSLQSIFSFILPVQNAFISSPFGFRWGRPHQGVDMAAPLGSPIRAAQGGKVIYSHWKQGYGNFIVIDHGHGLKTQYAHCAKILTHNGHVVQRGDIIGRVGSTGHSTGPHLHFEVLAQGVHRNPLPYIHTSGPGRIVER